MVIKNTNYDKVNNLSNKKEEYAVNLITSIFEKSLNNVAADILSLLSQYNESIEYYDKILKSDNKNINAYYNKGIALYNLGRYKEAIKCFDKVLELDDKNINAYNNKGNALSKLGKYEESIECYNKALELDNKNIYVYNNKGEALLSLERFEEAVECFDKALKLDNKNIDSLKNKLMALEKLNNYKNIISCIDDILKIHDLFESDYIEKLKLKKADYLFSLEDYKRALKSYEELKTDDFKIKEKIIICFMKLNNFQKAQKYISKLIANNKNNELYYYRGICLFNTNKYQECIKDFDTVIDYEDSKFYKALSLHYLGNDSEASLLITEYKNINEEDYSKKYNKFKEVIDKILIQDDKSDSAEKTDN